jgi:predicted ATPase
MPGAYFIRADLHVHTFADGEPDPQPDLDAYVTAAIDSGVGVLGITDHNTARFASTAVKAAANTSLLVLPGIEVSTHDGHLLGLFSPNAIATLEEFALPQSLQLKDLSPTEKRSNRSILDLVEDIQRRGGLAIPAHIDGPNGLTDRLEPAELVELLTNPALAGLEFSTKGALSTWFTDTDPDEHRRAAWKQRQNVKELRDRGLARLMNSDAHSIEKVGQDRTTRTLTRLRLDEPTFDAVCNAIAFSPKARCKAEIILPATYPRIESAEFHGGFLDGVTMEFSPNLNCIVGGRGSGKSTALLAIRAAVGAQLSPDDDPDAPGRMPDKTIVRFIDSAGSDRVATRLRGQEPVEEGSSSSIRLRLADLGQDESGRLARGYDNDPSILLAFLDGFVVRHDYDERAFDLTAQLADNAAELQRTSGYAKEIETLTSDQQRLDASLKAAEHGKVELIAQWATLLAAQAPFLDRLERELSALSRPDTTIAPLDLDELASEYGVDLSRKPASEFVTGAGGAGIRDQLREFQTRRQSIHQKASAELTSAAKPATETISRWKTDQQALEARLQAKQTELEGQGLKVQAGAVRQIANRLNTVKTKLAELRLKKDSHEKALARRRTLLFDLHSNWDSLYELRRATLRRIAQTSNESAVDLRLSVSFDKAGMIDPWTTWLGNTFGFRSPRVQRLATLISPMDFADALYRDLDRLIALRAEDGERFFDDATVFAGHRTWKNIFELQTMRLEDRPRLRVQEQGSTTPKEFDQLSAGQQRSVLLSLILCAERSEPLVLDQPEDHLDAQYIANAVVRHLERAKERRQVLIATHSPNLTVLGDAELVIPLHVVDRLGRPYSEGAVDRPETRDAVCELLEGGVEAYRQRGLRYGFRFASTPESTS